MEQPLFPRGIKGKPHVDAFPQEFMNVLRDPGPRVFRGFGLYHLIRATGTGTKTKNPVMTYDVITLGKVGTIDRSFWNVKDVDRQLSKEFRMGKARFAIMHGTEITSLEEKEFVMSVLEWWKAGRNV